MNIYVSHSGNYDYENELYKPIKASTIYKEHAVFLPHEAKNRSIPAKSQLRHTDLLVAEAFYPSTGQGIELGLASATGIPIICFYRSGSNLSNSLSFVTNKIIEYTDTGDLIEKFRDKLHDGVK